MDEGHFSKREVLCNICKYSEPDVKVYSDDSVEIKMESSRMFDGPIDEMSIKEEFLPQDVKEERNDDVNNGTPQNELSEVMEEAHFSKYELELPSDAAGSPTFDPDDKERCGDSVEITVGPYRMSDDPSDDEAISKSKKEEPDVKEECSDDANSGTLQNEMQSSLYPEWNKVSEEHYDSPSVAHSNERLRYEFKKSFTCKECHKIFLKQSYLLKHMLIHTGEKPFVCNICFKTFRQKGDLKNHIIRHTGEKRHLCTICGKVFVDGVGLKSHMITHTGERKFKCNISACNKSYAHPIGLEQHMSKHSGGRYFKCDYCHKTLQSRTGLKWHINKHTGAMPHRCSFCNKTFNSRTLLERHILSHTGEKPYVCATCGKEYSLRSSLKRHLSTHGE